MQVATFATKKRGNAAVSSGPRSEQRIQQHFIDSADLKYQAASNPEPPIAAAVRAGAGTCSVTSGGKVLALRQWPIGRRAGPVLPPLLRGGLNANARAGRAGAHPTTRCSRRLRAANDATQQFARQVRALGRPDAGDVLLA